jgi:hypothetical protein
MSMVASNRSYAIGDRWPDTLATQLAPLKAVRPVASRLGLRSSTARRGTPPRKSNATAKTVEGYLGGFCVCCITLLRGFAGIGFFALDQFVARSKE